MKKRLISSMLTALMAVSLTAGFSLDAVKAATTEDGVTTTSYGEYTEENPYELTFAFIEFYQQTDAGRSAVQDAVNEYMIPNYQMEVTFLPIQFAELQTKIQLMIAGGDALDIIPIPSSNAAAWIEMDGIVDMTPFLETEDGQAIIEALGSEETAKVGSMNGVLFGFPACKESIDLGGLCMRADICDELGFTEKYNLDRAGSDTFDGTCLSWDEADEIFAAVKEAHPEMYPLYLYSSSQQSRFTAYDTLVDTFGVLNLLDEDPTNTTVINMYEDEQYVEFCKKVASWYDAGYVFPDAATDSQGTASMMKAGNTFSYLTPIKPGFLSECNSQNGCDCYVIYFGPNSDGGYHTTTGISFIDTGICSNSEDPEMAFKFVRALYTDSTLYSLWQFGIEGTNYQVLEDGTAYFVEGEDGGNFAYHQGTGWELGNQYISYVWNDGTKDASYWDLLKSHNQWCYTSPAFGFMWDSSEYATQLTALTNALNTYRATLETGSCGVANVEETLKQLNDALYTAGLEEIMAEKQAQLDAWLADK